MKKRFPITLILIMTLLCSCGIPSMKNKNAGDEVTDFSGEWSDEAGGETVIDLWSDEDGLWHGEISRRDSDDQASFWSFSGKASGNVISYDNMECVRGIYDSEGEVTEKAVYENGSGSISLTDGKMSWQDDAEGAGNGIVFIHSGEY